MSARARRVVLSSSIIALAWMPIVLLSLLTWARTGTLDPLLSHAEVHVRPLIALGSALAAGSVLEIRTHAVVRSVLVDGVLLGLSPGTWAGQLFRLRHMRATHLLGFAWIAIIYAALVSASVGMLPDWALRWMSSTLIGAGRPDPSAAWWWYVLVAQPLVWWVLGRWLYRWLLWGIGLGQLARLQPVITAAHHDRAGGLGMLALPLDGLRVFILGLGSAIAAVWFDEIAADRAETSAFTGDLIVFVVVALGLMIAPYLPLTPALIRARDQATIRYAALARHTLVRFEQRWDLQAEPDISSVADLGATAAVVEQTRITIPSARDLTSTLIAALLPFVLVALAYAPSTAELVRNLVRGMLAG